jgi:hypothetical protein
MIIDVDHMSALSFNDTIVAQSKDDAQHLSIRAFMK